MPRGDLIVFMVVVAAAIALAEMSVQRQATSRYLVLAAIWLILTGLLIWSAYG